MRGTNIKIVVYSVGKISASCNAFIFNVKQSNVFGLFDPEGTVSLQNISDYRPNNTASHSRRSNYNVPELNFVGSNA